MEDEAEINSAKQSQRTSALCHRHAAAMQMSPPRPPSRCWLTANPLFLSHSAKMDHLKAHNLNLWIGIWDVSHSTSGTAVTNNAFTVWTGTWTNIDMGKRHILICGNSPCQVVFEVPVMAKGFLELQPKGKPSKLCWAVTDNGGRPLFSAALVEMLKAKP